jgi:hypothetical protein
MRGSALHRLHLEDGLATSGAARWEHFRLITEGPAGGVPLTDVLGIPHRRVIPYKLFEIVQGALLEVEAEPGEVVEASLTIATPLRRRFVYRAEAVAGADGRARLRVPYATDAVTPTHALGPWRVQAGAQRASVAVPESVVAQGAGVVVDLRATEVAPRAAGTAG